MVYIETNPKTLWREQFEADPRDFVVENTVGDPTEQDLKDLPTAINLKLDKTYNQGSLGACTAYALTHVQLFQNEKEFDTSIELDPLSLWKNMGHNPDNKSDGGDYLENALKYSKSKGIDGKLPNGKSTVYLTESYAYKSFGNLDERDYNIIKYFLSKGMPIYTAVKGTNKTWKEMLAGEVVTVLQPSETTGGHAISIFGIDNDYVYFYNSWLPIRPETTSHFKISRANMTKMLKTGVLNRRYRLTYDKKDIPTAPLFDDYFKDESSEEYKAVKWCKDNGIIKGSNGKLLPNEPLTREQMALILYRYSMLGTKSTPEPSITTTVEGPNKDGSMTYKVTKITKKKPKSSWIK